MFLLFRKKHQNRNTEQQRRARGKQRDILFKTRFAIRSLYLPPSSPPFTPSTLVQNRLRRFSLFLTLRHPSQIRKTRKLLVEEELYAVHRTVTVLSDNDLSNIFIFRIRIIIVFAIEERYNIRILLQGT